MKNFLVKQEPSLFTFRGTTIVLGDEGMLKLCVSMGYRGGCIVEALNLFTEVE